MGTGCPTTLAGVVRRRSGKRSYLIWVPSITVASGFNHRGENFTSYRVPGYELGETIHFDPWSRPLVDTERGRLEALPETVLAHEIGHAVFKLVSEEAVIQAVENPVREAMGMPRRRHF